MAAGSISLKGGERAVLLLHGLYSNALELHFLARRLHKAGHTVQVPHLPGYSLSAQSFAHAHGSWENWLHAASEALEELLGRHERVAVGGLCVGADLALMLAARFGKRIDRLMLLSTTLYYDGWSLPWYKFLLPIAYYTPLGRLYAYREREPFGLKNEQMRRLVARQMEQTGISTAGASRLRSSGLYQTHRLIRAVKKALPGVSNPALIIHAAEDDVSSLKSMRRLQADIGSKEIECLVLRDSYHMVSLDNEKELVADRMIAFLNGACTNNNGEILQ